MTSAAGRAQYDVLRIMHTLASEDDVDKPKTSHRKQGRPTTPRMRYPDVLTSEDILQEKYQELGQLLASQFVERKALTVLETTLLGQKKRRQGRPASAQKEHKNGRRTKATKQRPSSARTFSQSEEARWWYDSDNTEYTEMSVTSSAKRVSFADDVVSFSGESSVVITELTEDDTDFEERIKRKPRVTLEEEEMEAQEMKQSNNRDIEHELIKSILRSPRPSTRRGNKSPTRSSTPTTPRRKSPSRTTKSEKQHMNLTLTRVENENDVKVYDEKGHVETADEDDYDEKSERKSRRKSPRKNTIRSTTPRENSKSPRKGKGVRPSSPSKKDNNSKRSPRKNKPTAEEENLESQSPPKESVPIDNQLTNSNNKHIKSWLRQKEAAIRKQKREELKKERVKLEAERKEREERAQRIEEAETRYAEWVKKKKRVNKRIARQVAEDGVEQMQDAVSEETRPLAPSPRRVKKSAKKKEVVRTNSNTTHDNSIGIVRDYTGDWSDSVNCKRDLAAERERDEEKRQAREAKKRERQQKAAIAAQKKNEPKRTFPRASKSPPKVSPRKHGKNERVGLPEQKPKTKPSNNPFKGMTYDQWLNQKQKSGQERKAETDQELADPDLEDLIPLLAKHRIQQATEPSRRVDSGLSRPKSSTAPRKPSSSKAFDSNDQNPKPYTWNNSDQNTKDNKWKTFPKSNSSLRVNTPTPPGTPLPNRTNGGKSNKNDIMDSVRPEPQGCEIPAPMSHCQRGSKDNIEQDNIFVTQTLIP